jgi:Ni,Fe-hydrogenase III small subunit
VIPVDVAVPGCPPSPLSIMSGILAAISPGADSGPRPAVNRATADTP